MDKSYRLSLLIFRRDLRLQDNTAFNLAAASSDKVLPCFIFDKRQIENNEYKGDAALTFMASSLKALQAEFIQKKGKLFFFHGIAEDVVAKLLKTIAIDAVYINRDYTPFSRKRDSNIESVCKKQHVDFFNVADALLTEPEEVRKADQKPYTIFTPFFRKAQQLKVRMLQKVAAPHFYTANISYENEKPLQKILKTANPNIVALGGRSAALPLLKRIPKLKDYEHLKSYPAENGSTKLSAHLKFGTLSIREVYRAVREHLGPHHGLIMQLYWRDFFTHIGFHFPFVFKDSFQEKYRDLVWQNKPQQFRRWCQGQTGFPIIDAAMRELNTTGYMNNRLRMLTASFLTKDLHLNWRWGERYFAQKLLDYDPAINNGNWQWVASTGCDAAPYFRIFNPWTQQKLYDADCLYIKRWVIELSRIPNREIHAWYKHADQAMTNYPTPMCEHAKEAALAKHMYSAAR